MRAELRSLVGDSPFQIWLEPVELASWDGEHLALTAPLQTAGWVTARYGPVLEQCARHQLGDRVRVTLNLASADAPTTEQGSAGPSRPSPTALNPRYRFEQFIIGENNQLAHAAALAGR